MSIKKLKHGKKKLLKFNFKNKENCNCFIEIISINGGSDSSYYTDIIYKQCKNLSKELNFNFFEIKKKKNNIGNIKYLKALIKGPFSYVIFKTEEGINKFINKSYTKKKEIIQTSYCVLNVLKEKKINKIDIKKKDLKIETFKSSGAGGQHVNKTNSAVRITHIPTSIKCKSSSRRSQNQNINNAFKVINKKLEENNKSKKYRNFFSQKKYNRIYYIEKSMVYDYKTKKKNHNIKKIIKGYILPFIIKKLV
ncbi:peptide chain release factor-like protein [Candidatus Vidania fulgoroideorum]